jgi:hypothetical protein
MTYKGRIREGVVVLEEGVRLPDGTAVTVALADDPPTEPAGDGIYRVAELAVPTGIPDLAMNIDHYLYGHPKAGDAGQ